MDKEKAIGILQAVKAGTADAFIRKAVIKDAIDLAISALEKQEKDRWIPVTERPPEEDCACRVTEDNGDYKYIIDCYWSNHKKQFEVWSDYNDCYIPLTNVTAWKPKEEPYKAEEDTNDEP